VAGSPHAAPVARALTEVAAAACSLGEPTMTAVANASVAAAAQLRAAGIEAPSELLGSPPPGAPSGGWLGGGAPPPPSSSAAPGPAGVPIDPSWPRPPVPGSG